jgi:peptidoglycan L-alanyl-D-glutamate endopeptidase CwlK
MPTANPNAAHIAAYLTRGASQELAETLFAWDALLQAKRVPVLIYCIYRSNEAQAILYAQGRTKPGQICTYAKPGQSAHNITVDGHPASRAFDAAPMIAGRPSWETKGEALQIWNEMGIAAKKLGLEWGRNYKKLGGDWSHFQLPDTL